MTEEKTLPARTSATLTPVLDEDTEALVALRLVAMRDSLTRIGRFDPERARARFLQGFSPADTRHIVVAGQRVGLLVVKQRGDHLLLDHLYIHPAWQAQGIGAQVLQTVLQQAQTQGLSVKVTALKGSAANRFYLRHGFELVEQTEFDLHYRHPGRGHVPLGAWSITPITPDAPGPG